MTEAKQDFDYSSKDEVVENIEDEFIIRPFICR